MSFPPGRTTYRLPASLLVVLLVVALPAAAASEGSEQQTRRFALIVANNDSVDADVEPLEYADDDGARYYEMFSSFADDATLLTTLDADSQRIFPEIARQSAPPSRAELEEAVSELSHKIRRAEKRGETTEIFLVFTGHGNVGDDGEGYLSLRNSKLRRSDVYRDIVRPLDADFTHLIVDACHAYFMVHSRGGEEGEWRDDRSGQTLDRQLSAYLAGRSKGKQQSLPTVGVIVSTAGNAEVHEWSRYRAGVFSHELRSGLLGAADADGDGEITYAELEAYLVAANASVTNPRARIDVYAHPPRQDQKRPLTALDRFGEATILQIPSGSGGRYHLEDSRGLRYADFHVDRSVPTRIALLREPLEKKTYYLMKGDRQARVPLEGVSVSSAELAFNDLTRQSRGSVEESFRSELFRTPFGPSFVAGFRAGRSSAAAGGAGRPHENREGKKPEAWELEASVAYGLGPNLPLGRADSSRGGLEHRAELSAVFRHDSGWGVGPLLEWGGAFLSQGRQHHRLSGGLAGSYSAALSPAFRLTPSLRVGHAGYLLKAETLRSDPLGLHAEASVRIDWRLSQKVTLFAGPGFSADLFTIDHDRRPNNEKWFLRPTGRLGVTF